MPTRRILISLCIFTITLSSVIFASPTLPLIGTVKGFGLDTKAGTGGKVIKVTNLSADPNIPGSFPNAIKTKGPRIIVFEVAGVIDLNKKPLYISRPFITIAGQTAPSPGITIIRGGINIGTHDVLVQHISVRPGDAGMPKKSGWESDAISASGADAYNIVIDHCSATWATDENLSVSGLRHKGPKGTSRKVTISNCIIAECLYDSTHSKGPHSKGSLIHDYCSNVAVIANLYANNYQRNPYFKAHTTGVIVNNIIYNPGKKGIHVGYVNKEWVNSQIEPKKGRIAAVSNVVQYGTDTLKGLAMIVNKGDVYIEDNIGFSIDGKPLRLKGPQITVLDKKPVWPQGLKPIPSEKVIEYVTKNAGARPKDRDKIDQRIINDFLNRKGKIIDSQQQVGGYPSHKMVTRKLNVPKTNIQQWLDEMAQQVE